MYTYWIDSQKEDNKEHNLHFNVMTFDDLVSYGYEAPADQIFCVKLYACICLMHSYITHWHLKQCVFVENDTFKIIAKFPRGQRINAIPPLYILIFTDNVIKVPISTTVTESLILKPQVPFMVCIGGCIF